MSSISAVTAEQLLGLEKRFPGENRFDLPSSRDKIFGRVGQQRGEDLERLHYSAPIFGLSFFSFTPPNRLTLLSLGMQPSPKVKPHLPRSS